MNFPFHFSHILFCFDIFPLAITSNAISERRGAVKCVCVLARVRVQFTQLPIKIRYTHKMSDEFFIAIMRISFYNMPQQKFHFRNSVMDRWHACGVWSACVCLMKMMMIMWWRRKSWTNDLMDFEWVTLNRIFYFAEKLLHIRIDMYLLLQYILFSLFPIDLGLVFVAYTQWQHTTEEWDDEKNNRIHLSRYTHASHTCVMCIQYTHRPGSRVTTTVHHHKTIHLFNVAFANVNLTD